MQQMVALNNPPTDTANADLEALLRELNHRDELSFARLYNAHVQNLFNYGMNACGDHRLVVDSIQEVFTSVHDCGELLIRGGEAAVHLFKSFRCHLLKVTIVQKERSAFAITKTTKGQFANKIDQTVEGLTMSQREAIFLKFESEFNYGDVALIMNLRVESVYDLISQAFEILHRR